MKTWTLTDARQALIIRQGEDGCAYFAADSIGAREQLSNLGTPAQLSAFDAHNIRFGSPKRARSVSDKYMRLSLRLGHID